MSALVSRELPSGLASYAAILTRPRRGLAPGEPMPRIERSVRDVTIDPAWLASYCDSVGLGASAYLPPLALQLAVAPLHLSLLADAQFPFPALGLVHVSQRVEQAAELRASGHFDVTTFTSDAERTEKGTRFALVTEARSGGTLVWRGETVALSRMGATSEARAPRTKEAEPAGEPAFDAEIDVPEETGRRYAKVAGDLNPIHQHALLARPFGFRRAIVHGTWTAARALALAAASNAGPGALTLEVRFRLPVELPSRIRVLGEEEGRTRRVRAVTLDRTKTYVTATLETL